MRAPPTDLLPTDLLPPVHKRRPTRGEGIRILGDAQLLDFRLERVGFG